MQRLSARSPGKPGDKAADKAAVSRRRQNVLLVSHGDIIKAILADALGCTSMLSSASSSILDRCR